MPGQDRFQAQTLPSFVSHRSLPEQLAWADAPPILCLTPHTPFLSLLGCRSGRWVWNRQGWATWLLPLPAPSPRPCHSVSLASLFLINKAEAQRMPSLSCCTQFKLGSCRACKTSSKLLWVAGKRGHSPWIPGLEPRCKQNNCLPREQSLFTLGF